MARKPTIGAGIALDGEKEFRQAVSNINQDIRVLDSEMKKVSAEFDDNGRSVKDLAAKQDVLGRQMLNQIDKVEALKKALQNSAREYGEADKRTKEWQISLNKAETELAQTRKEIDKTTKELNNYGNEAKQAGTATADVGGKGTQMFSAFKSGAASIAGVATAMIGLAVAAYQQVKAFADIADELMRMSAETSLTTDELQELQYIGDGVGVSLDTISSSLSKLINNMSDAKAESGEAYNAFRALGVSFQDDVTGQLLNSNEVFQNVIDALGKMANETERTAIAQDLLGRSAAELNPLIEAGSAAMKELADEAHKANAIMSAETVAALDEAGDRLDHWWQQFKATMGEAIVTTGNWLAGNEKATGASLESLTSLGDKIEEIKATYEAASLAANKSLDEQIGLWDNMGAAANKSLGDIKAAVTSQIAWLQDYNTNLANLSQRHIEGLDALVLKLSDGTKESAAVVAGLATASDGQIRDLIDNMNEVDDRQANLARQFAEIKTDTIEQLNSVYGGLKSIAEDQLDATDEAARAAANTMNSFIAGIRAKKDEVTNAFRGAFSGIFGSGTSGNSLPQSTNYGQNAFSSGGTSSGGQSLNIQPGTVVINLDGKQIARSTFPFNVEQSSLQGTNLIK